MATNPPSSTLHRGTPLAEQLSRAAVAELWQQLHDAAERGDDHARLFLRTFAPFARDRLDGHRS